MLRNCGFVILMMFSSALYAQEVREAVDSDTAEEEMVLIYFPTKLSFWNIPHGGETEQKLHLRQGDERKFSIKKVETSSEYLTASVEGSGGIQSKTYTVSITLSGKTPPGSVSEMLTIHTDHPKKPTVKVPVYGNVLDGITIDPQAFGIQLNYYKRQGMGMIRISSTDDVPFEVKGINSSHPSLHAALVPSEECCSHIVAVLVTDPEKTITKPSHATLHIETTSPQGLVVIPVLIDVPGL